MTLPFVLSLIAAAHLGVLLHILLRLKERPAVKTIWILGLLIPIGGPLSYVFWYLLERRGM